MNFRFIISGLFVLILSAYGGMVLAAGGTPVITQGAMLGNSCAGCHGTGGRSPGAIPSINGKTAQFISQSLMDFRSGKRPATVMGRHAKGYSDEEIKLIAEYFSSQK